MGLRCKVLFCVTVIFHLYQISSGTVNCPIPSNFPSHISVSSQPFQNWARAIQVESILTAQPKSTDDVVILANWAFQNGYTLRARGYMHNWSPLVVPAGKDSGGNVILIDTSKYLTSMEMASTSPPAVQTQTGASLEALLTFLEDRGYGLNSHPAPGDITIGGVIAVDGHGSGIPLKADLNTSNSFRFGSLSNMVTSLDAVVWNETRQGFQIQTFDRSNPETKALLTNLGRIFLTQVTLRVVPSFNMRCVSKTDIPASELFAHPSKVNFLTRSFSKYLEMSGSVETILFPFTTKPWTKIWTVTPRRPLFSRPVSEPYNYGFSDNLPVEFSELAEKIVTGDWNLAPAFGLMGYSISAAGLKLGLSDIWGPAKNVQLYVRSTTLRVTANGYAVITRRENIQLITSQFYSFYTDLIDEYANKGLFPINGPLEIRVTGLDFPDDLEISGSDAPTLSALKPVDGRPDMDVAVWFDCLTFPSTPYADEFMVKVEDFMFTNFTEVGVVRPEWSKGWGYTNTSAWTSDHVLSKKIPTMYTPGVNENGNTWSFAISIFNKYDPKRVFTNTFLNSLLI